ncbi:BPI fold-containing family A member 2 [Eumetopias jubatus]|uniref:BPI fold-containing family A member 2 n=1 Tax=Eumetopias jubatus TaxID=34886 RepID=UPI001016FF36|nr:BPI fold-containing family A member 2 [Eumetopias jubatus]
MSGTEHASLLSFLSGSTLDVTIKTPLALPQTRSGQVSLTLQNCEPVFTGIHMRTRNDDGDDGDWDARGTFSSGSRAGLSTPISAHGPRSGSSEFPPWVRGSPSGLLTGTSASLLGNLGDDQNNVVNKLKPAVEKGLETVDNTLGSVVQKLTSDLGKLQESKGWLLAKEKVQEMKNLVNDVLSKISPAKDETLGLNIINSRTLKIKVELTPDGEGVNIRVPIVANVTLALPVIGQVVDLKPSLDLLTDVRVAVDAQTGAPRVIIGKCSSDPDSISRTVLDRSMPSVPCSISIWEGAAMPQAER